MENTTDHEQHAAWNRGVIVGQKSPFNLKEIWAIRVRLQLQHRVRELAMFDLALDSKLRACDLVKMRVRDICRGEHVSPRATVMQQKTSRPVQFEITQPTRDVVSGWIKEAKLGQDDYLFPSRIHESPHIGTRQYARIVDSLGQRDWAESVRIWDTFNATNQSILDLPADKKSSGSATAAWPHQAGEHCALPWY